MPTSDQFISLADVYLAYRKAKAEAFHENEYFAAVAFAEYERQLHKHLVALHGLLSSPESAWAEDRALLGGFVYAPKAVGAFETSIAYPEMRAIDPSEEWEKLFRSGGRRRTDVDFRLVIAPTVEFRVISALWILKVGHLFDARLSDEHAYAHRVRRLNHPLSFERLGTRQANSDCSGIFPPYFTGYRQWRENGLQSMRESLSRGDRILAITMDLRRFYHNVNPDFLLDRRFHEALNVRLEEEELRFTSHFVAALHTWYRQTPDHKRRPAGAIPVGLSASKVIANVLLHEFDSAVVDRLRPVYYGRYVDDIFLVLPHKGGADNGSDLLKSLARKLSPLLTEEHTTAGDSSLRLNMPYARGSELIFTGSKQKIFDLSGGYGLDLVKHISEQIRSQSSEHRLLAELPATDLEMASRALLATPDATLEADALRKAGAVSVRRLGFALLLRDVEAYALDLRPREWRSLRRRFYVLVERHLLTPRGFFDYTAYLHRVFGLMVACGDFSEVNRFLDRFKKVVGLLRSTTTAGTSERVRFRRCLTYYCGKFFETALAATTVDRFSKWAELRTSLRRVVAIGQLRPHIQSRLSLREQSRQLLLSDLGRRPYKEYWFFNQSEDLPGPRVPPDISVRRLIRLGGVRKFREFAELKMPFWPALAFPTRPLSVAEIGLIAPRLLGDTSRLRDAVMALRGARVPPHAPVGLTKEERDTHAHFLVPDSSKRKPRIAVTSVKTSDTQWKNAVAGKPDHSLKRYQSLRRLINQVLGERPRARYVALPECSFPLRGLFDLRQSSHKIECPSWRGWSTTTIVNGASCATTVWCR